LQNPRQVAVGGIEEGPASKAGVHWGDVLISVNGVPTSGKTADELESLFSTTVPALMRIQIDRLGSKKTVDFRLERAEEVARQNGKRFVGDQIVPSWTTEENLHCFLRGAH
jgi:C-terminal processing protease CtpA/Prc